MSTAVMRSANDVVSRLGLGLAALGRPAYINLGRQEALPAERTVERMRAASWDVLDTAYAAGIRWIDTARSYGQAEEFLAGWLDDRGHDDLTVSSKWGYAYVADWAVEAEVHEVKEHSVDRLRSQWGESRELLGDRIALYQVHSLTVDSPLFDSDELLRALARLPDEGVRIGFSTSGPAQAQTVRRALELRVDGRRLFDAVQATWNPLEPSAGAALSEAHDAGLHVLVKEPLANGRLAVDPPPVVTELARVHGVGADAIALAAVLAQPWADTVLLGSASREQLRANLRAAGVTLEPSALEALATLATDPVDYWSRRSALHWA